jgi:hypothetical protein
VGAFAMPGEFAIFNHGFNGGHGLDNGTDTALPSDVIVALDSEDYTAYMTALDKQWESYRASITHVKFDEMVARHKEMKNDSMNLSDDGRMFDGRHGDMGRDAGRKNVDKNDTNMTLMHEAQMKLQNALDSGDYASWKEAVDALNANAPSGMPHFINNMTNKITVDNFATYVDFTKALQDKDFDTAKQFATTLGIDGYEFPMMPMGDHMTDSNMADQNDASGFGCQHSRSEQSPRMMH